jgi:hypothetical protein
MKTNKKEFFIAFCGFPDVALNFCHVCVKISSIVFLKEQALTFSNFPEKELSFANCFDMCKMKHIFPYNFFRRIIGTPEMT